MAKLNDKYGYSNRKIADCHWHIELQYPIEDTYAFIKNEMKYLGLDKVLILSLEHTSTIVADSTNNVKSLYLKHKDGGNIYAFASLHHYGDERDSADGFLEQVKLYRELGFDGLKMLEGKLNMYAIHNAKLDSEQYEKAFDYCEKNGFPILMHAGDCAFHGDKDILAGSEKVYAEMFNVLQRHPKLRITFAHMLFMTHDVERMSKLLDDYENVTVDLTLGGDIFINFSNEIEEWRAFFRRYGNRVLYGTDSYNVRFSDDEPEEDYISASHKAIRLFFESKEPFRAAYYDWNPAAYGENVIIKPLLLEKEVADDVCYNNFISQFGAMPKPVNIELAREYCNNIIKGYENGSLFTKGKAPSWWAQDAVDNLARGNELALENLNVIKKSFENA